MAATFPNGRFENIKQCIYISYFGGFPRAIHAIIGFQGQRKPVEACIAHRNLL